MNDGHFGDNEGPQPMRGEASLILMTAVSVLIHTLALGLLCTTLVNPFAWEAKRQDPTIIQVSLSSLVENSLSRPDPVSLSLSRRGNIDGDNSREPAEVPVEKQQESQSNQNDNKQESRTQGKTDTMAAVSNIQLTPGGTAGRAESVGGSPTSAGFGGPNRFPPTGEDLAVVKPRYALTPSPPYPMAARNWGQEGLVLLTVEVLANGRTGQVAVKKSSGYALLDQSAQTAVRSWRFEPAKRQQTPQAMTVDIPIRFSIENDR